jgi:pyruvate dehydrogenase E1 component
MSCPSFTELARDGAACERDQRLHGKSATPWVVTQLAATQGPVVAATDYIRAWPEQIRAYLPEGRRYLTLGTDGYGRSDTRAKLRRYFEVDRHYIAHATLYALAQDGRLAAEVVADAAARYGITPDQRHPWQH